MPAFFTVVIVNYNSGGCLARCLEALEAQRFRDFTVIVVDNGSTDDSLQALDKMPPAWQAIRLGRNTGFAAANNHAFALATSPWVAALNPDAFAEPDWLEQLALGIQRYPEAAAFGSRDIARSSSPMRRCAMWAAPAVAGAAISPSITECAIGSGCSSS